ncbi:MAG: outer membrane beta-barrel protein [Planctomycetaceae bacterium]|nr:outer membrane beta-barrel protein [Planctomycetaceae bacterium]
MKNEFRVIPVDFARRVFCFLAIIVFLIGFSFGSDRKHSSQNVILQNPLEKQFNNPQREQENRLTKRSRFTDDTIPSSAPLSATSDSSKIRQVSNESVSQNQSQNIWDNPHPATGNEMTLSDWGNGSTSTTSNNLPSISSSSSLPSPTVPGISYNQPEIFNGLGVNATPNQLSGYPNTATGSYSNIETSMNASPLLNNPYAYSYSPEMIPSNLSGFSGNNDNSYGVNSFGYYPSNAGQVYANPYDPYAYYNNGAALSNGYYGQSNGGMSYPTDMMGQQMNGNEIAGQQNSLYQALLLQEMMLRQREQEREDKNETETNQDKKSDTEKTPEQQWTMKQLMPIHVSSPLGETIFSGVKMLSPFCTPTGPHRGVGQPLLNRSWLDHPYYFGGFCGWISGSQLVSGLIDQKNGGSGGLIFGYNLNEYWGLESRLHFASIDIMETAAGRLAFQNWYAAVNPDDPVPTLTTRNNRLSTLDIAVHYYPLGNAKWRPFFKYGLGFSRESFVDTFGAKRNENTVTMPFGVGLRYWWNENLAIQADLLDNVIFSSGITKTQNNIAFCVGLTYSFGNSKKKRPTAYWPYTPSLGSKW